jgi:prepilin-type N-terminal cleavage/methylation domain-containing protein
MRSESGMTLLEVLVALMVLAMTGLLLSEGFRLGSRIWDRSETEGRLAVERIEVLGTLRRLVEQAEPPGPLEGSNGLRGDDQGVSFLSFSPARLTGGAGRLIHLRRDPGSGQVRLRLADPEEPEQGEDLLLLEHSASMSLRYFGFDATRDDTVWLDRWEDRGELPQIVEIAIGFSDGRPPLLLRAAPRRRYSVECLAFPGPDC